MTKTKKAHEKLDVVCQCDRCVKVTSGGRSARSSARSRDYDLRLFLGLEQPEAERLVRLIAKHGVERVVTETRHSLGVVTLLAYHSGAIMLGNARPKTCVLVRPKGYAAEWCESVVAARAALEAPRHRTADVAADDRQLDLFGAA